MFCLVFVFATMLQGILWSATHQVNIINFAFVPQTVNVVQSDTVLWINQSVSLHTTTSGVNGTPNGFWNSGTMAPGDSFTFVVNLTPNTYPYYCAFHYLGGMTGDIVVATGIEEDAGKILTGFQISKNSPDPFSFSTTIKYEITNPSVTIINVYDMVGQLVKTLVNAYITPGKYSITWNGTDEVGKAVPAGIYFLKLDNGAYRATEKLLLIK